jgi:hypothetical protein
MIRWIIERVNIWVLLVALLVSGFLTAVIAVLIFVLPDSQVSGEQPVAMLTIIPAHTATVTMAPTQAFPSPTVPVAVDGISQGVYVQISGTDGVGLRLRSGPSTGNEPRFLGMDSEVFLVKDGPREADGFTWWYLEAPYDPGRSGWAVSAYLAIVNQPVDTPTP